MNRKDIIETLEMENELICFNPLTGEDIPLEFVNDLNRKCYDAHCRAITFIQNSISIDWIEKWKNGKTSLEQVVADKIMMDYIHGDWEKENEKGN